MINIHKNLRVKNILLSKILVLFEFSKFILTGIVNAILSYLTYLLLLNLLSYQVAYLIAYVVGITTSYYINSSYTFKEKLSFGKFFKFLAVYGAQYLLSVFLLEFAIKELHVNCRVAPLLVVLITIVPTFLISRYFIKEKERRI